jgi:hypothetical protein
MNRIRHSKELLYEKIYNKYKTQMYDIDNIIESLNDKDDKYILFVLEGIKYGLNNTGKHKILIESYNKTIKKYKKIIDSNETNNWNKIICRANYYIMYKKHMKNYLRNRAIILLYLCIEPRKATEIIDMKYSNDSNIQENGIYFLPNVKKIKFNNEYVDLDKKLFIALKTYIKDIEEGQKLFDINLSRLCKIVERILGIGINDIKKERLTMY